MAFQVELQSREQILGNLIRTILTETDLNDVAPGSTLATLLEAVAASQFQISLSALKILQSTNLESLVGSLLDQKAESIKLPNTIGGIGRKPASQASGSVTIGSGFSKISSKLYAGKPLPFAGSTNLYVEDASSFPASGSIYIARNTVNRFEGPISYSSVINNGSYWTISLNAPLTKSHLLSDLVVLSQGGDRTVPAGTIVQIPANNQSPAISFTTAQLITIPDGEAEGQVQVTCVQFGEVGNALAGSISQFSSSPFSGATVTNQSSFSNGKSTESDEDLRQRIKIYPATLSRGTKTAILGAIIGTTDPDTGRTIQSANVIEPVESGDFAKVFIDDGTGLEPTFGRQPYELLLQGASGQETRFKTSQYPVTPAIAEGTNSGPFSIQAGQTITVHVDEVSETYTITGSNYANLNSATVYEIVRDLNSQSNIVGFRTLDGGTRLALFDLSGTAEILSVDSGDLQAILGLPLAELRPIFVYQDSHIQSFRGHTATLYTRPRNQWSLTSGDLSDVLVIVDGVTQKISISDSDFIAYQATIASATIANWAAVLSKKIAGVKFTVSGQTLIWSTYQTFSAGGTLEIPALKEDGTSAGWVGVAGMWEPESSGGRLSDVGYPRNYQLNRFTGEITLSEKPPVGSKIEIGSRSTRAHIRTIETPSGLYALSPSLSVGNSRLVLGFDGNFAIRSVTIPGSATFTPTIPDPIGASNVIRATADSADVFKNAVVGDWLYLVKDSTSVPTWGLNVEGFYKLKAVGLSAYSTNQSYTNLSAEPISFANLTASVEKDKIKVVITKIGHGLSTGDLITVSASSSIGGISAPNLSVVNALVTVLSDDKFSYNALAAATSSANGTLSVVGTNLMLVNHPTHGFATGALINTTVSTGFDGISSGSLSVSSAIISVIDSSYYIYRAASATNQPPLSVVGGTINTLVYIADCWVEFEVSTPQLADWTPLLSSPQTLTDLMVHIFRSTATPQLVDFGAISNATVDQVVTAINSSVIGGTAVKISPKQIDIRSNDFNSGTCAVLAVVGNASNMISASTDESQQAHIGYAVGGDTHAGFPVVKEVVLPTAPSPTGYPTHTYIKVDYDLTDVTSTASSPTIQQPAAFPSTYPEGFEHVWVTGRQAGLVGRVYNNQTTAPYIGLMTGADSMKALNTSDTSQDSLTTLNRYANLGLRLRDLSINNHDKFVAEMDLNPSDKTVAVPAYKLAKIQDIDPIAGSGKGQVISFQLKDPDDSDKHFFDPTSVYKAFDFRDFKILTKSVGLYREDVSDRALILRSMEYGGSARLKLAIRFPTQANQADFEISHSNYFSSAVAQTLLSVVLPSQSLIAGSTLSSGSFKIVPSASGTIYNWRITSGALNSGNQYVSGNALNIAGTEVVSDSYEILSATYGSYATASAQTTWGSNVVVVNQTAHGFQNGDLVSIAAAAAIGGISSGDLSQSDTAITYINANQFSYLASASAPINTGSITSATRPAVNIILPTGTTDGSTSTVVVTAPSHGLVTGSVVSVTASVAIGGISAVNLTVPSATVTYISPSQFSYTASAASTSVDSQSLSSVTRSALSLVPAITATTSSGSAVVTITNTGHGLLSGDTISIVSPAIGGISSANLSVTSTISVIDANNFTYTAAAAAPADSGSLSTVSGGSVTIAAPGDAGISGSATYNAAVSPLATWALAPKTWTDLATAISGYNSVNPIATAEAIGSAIPLNPIKHPTYVATPNAVAYSGDDIEGAFEWHSFACKLSGSAGIWQYGPTNDGFNNIKATVQSEDSIFPTVTDASGTSYSPIDEEIQIVPTNTKTVAAWLSFSAASSLPVLANIERIRSDLKLQISSKEDGSVGAVHITGVSANSVDTAVIGNGTDDGDATRIAVLSANAKPMMVGEVVKITNGIASEILRSYRSEPTNPSNTTAANTANINTYFRTTNAIKYIRTGTNSGRLVFLRNGMGPSQTEPMAAGNTVQLTNLGNGLVQVTSAQAGGPLGTGKLSARVGDMMYIQPTSPFSVDARCKAIGSRETDGANPEYLGYPVSYVIDDYNIVVIAPNITSFGLTALTSSTDLVFMPAIWNEKNIKTNHAAGAVFDEVVNSNKAYFLVKKLGSGMVAIWLQNSASESTDTMMLSELSVNTDDYVVLGDGFNPANRGTFKLVAHNSRNLLIIANPSGGTDEIVDSESLQNGGVGDRKWRVGPLSNGYGRSIRIIDAESIKLGDYLRISTPVSTSQWFNDTFIGSWKITKIGYQGVDYTGALLPHTSTSGSADNSKICPYIDFEMPAAPVAVLDTLNSPVDSFVIGSNDSAIGFTEGTPFSAYRIVAGHGVSPQNPENSDLFLVPQISTQKMSETFGTAISAMYKIGFDQVAHQGIDGYKVFNGLVQQAHKIIDGVTTNTAIYPGVRAAGASIEVLPPLIKSVFMSLQVKPKDGITLNSITELVKATVSEYINGLGVGKPVILSEIIRVVQGLPGVYSVSILSTLPVATEDRIAASDIEKCIILNASTDISVG